jgi:hypothetical protein
VAAQQQRGTCAHPVRKYERSRVTIGLATKLDRTTVQVRRATERLFMEVVPDFVREMKVNLFGENFALTVRSPYNARTRASCAWRCIRTLLIKAPCHQDDEISLSDMSDFSPLRRVHTRAHLPLFVSCLFLTPRISRCNRAFSNDGWTWQSAAKSGRTPGRSLGSTT